MFIIIIKNEIVVKLIYVFLLTLGLLYHSYDIEVKEIKLVLAFVHTRFSTFMYLFILL
jgi:hypothetical protein